MSGEPMQVEQISISINTASSSGSSAANSALIGATILGWLPRSAGASVYQIRTIVVNADGSITVTLNGNPTVATATIVVTVCKFR